MDDREKLVMSESLKRRIRELQAMEPMEFEFHLKQARAKRDWAAHENLREVVATVTVTEQRRKEFVDATLADDFLASVAADRVAWLQAVEQATVESAADRAHVLDEQLRVIASRSGGSRPVVVESPPTVQADRYQGDERSL